MFRLCNGNGGLTWIWMKFGFEICNFKHWSCDILERYCGPTCVMQLTFGSHSSLDALLVATVLTPVSVVAIYDAALSASTRIGQVASH